MNVEAAFNLLVKLARANKLTWDEHQKVQQAIDIVLEELNADSNVHEVRELDTKKKS
jgi:hypothetical protein|tara:strand:- start:189 stop:359 length:171 start_codon:yes stop_codon:yes gene_type:complete